VSGSPGCSIVRYSRILAVLLLLATVVPAWADRVVMKTGEVYKGEILSQDDRTIVIKTSFAEFRLAKHEIEDVVYEGKVAYDGGYSAFRLSSLWRSVLFPGWGQLYGERVFMGLTYGGLTLGSLTATLLVGAEYRALRTDYLSRVHEQSLYDRVERWRSAYNYLLIGTVVLHVWQAADSWIFARRVAAPIVTAFLPSHDGFLGAVAVRF
jgi:TM2 domain-containing membrane protein YozV